MKHLLKLSDWSKEEIMDVLNLADQLKYEQKHGIAHHRLAGQTLGMIFQKSSTRTRVSFETGMYQLGGQGAVFKLERSSDRPWRAGAGYSAGTFPVFGRHYDPDLCPERSGGSGGIRLDPDHQRTDRLLPSLSGAGRFDDRSGI